MDLEINGDFPALARVLRVLIDAWPEHSSYLQKSFPAENSALLRHADRVAALIATLANERLPQICEDYRWTCEQLLEEELYFRRHDRYRLDSFAEAQREVYSNPGFMNRYVNGLLLSHLCWHNHRHALRVFEEQFLPRLPSGAHHLEIGPGHGIYMAIAAKYPACESVTGWDISETSVSQTREALELLNAVTGVKVEKRDILQSKPNGDRFDSVVISEVLEHLEDPNQALLNLRSFLEPDGLIFINIPVNSPAPDHIYLLRTPEEADELITRNGFQILQTECAPATGYSLSRALKNTATISCIITATPAR